MGRCQEDRANIDAAAANARVSRPAREHLALAAAEIELAQLQGLLINRAGVEMAMETAFRQIRDTILSTPDRLPIDGAHRTMFRNALRETLSDALKMLPSMMAGETAQ